MRLLRLVHSLAPSTGGVAEAIRQFGLAAESAGCALTVVTLDEPQADWLKGLPFRVVALGPCRNGYGYTAGLRPWLRKHVLSYDVVIVDGLWQYHGWAVWREVRGRRPYFVMPHGMLDPWFKKHYPLKHLKKWLYWPWAEYRILRNATGVIFTAEEERRKAAHSFWLYCVKNEIIAPLGIIKPDYDRAAGQRQLEQIIPGLNNKPYLIFMGRLHEKKGVDLLIDAYRKLDANRTQDLFQLVIAGPAGDEAYFNQLRRRAEGSAGIHFSGMLHGDVKWAALAGAEALILPSHQENFGLVVVETLAVGTPVLLSDKVDIWREVVEAGAGWVAPDSREGVFDLLNRFQSAERTDKPVIRQRVKQCFEQHYRLDQSVRHLMERLKHGLK